MARTVDRQHVVAVPCEQPRGQEVEAGVGAAAGLEHDDGARLLGPMQIEVDRHIGVVDPHVLDAVQQAIDLAGAARHRGQVRAGVGHLSHRRGERRLAVGGRPTGRSGRPSSRTVMVHGQPASRCN